jgi:hypothetical protein
MIIGKMINATSSVFNFKEVLQPHTYYNILIYFFSTRLAKSALCPRALSTSADSRRADALISHFAIVNFIKMTFRIMYIAETVL